MRCSPLVRAFSTPPSWEGTAALHWPMVFLGMRCSPLVRAFSTPPSWEGTAALANGFPWKALIIRWAFSVCQWFSPFSESLFLQLKLLKSSNFPACSPLLIVGGHRTRTHTAQGNRKLETPDAGSGHFDLHKSLVFHLDNIINFLLGGPHYCFTAKIL